MNLLQELWKDESGLVLSAEAVTIGTVGVLGSIVGLSTVGHAVNAELKEMAAGIRSLDQSYAYAGQRGCRSWTAGSCYIQQDVQQSLAELSENGAMTVKEIQQQIEADRKANSKAGTENLPRIAPTPEPEPLPNQIPVTEPTPEDK
jgi:hypothetical protein